MPRASQVRARRSIWAKLALPMDIIARFNIHALHARASQLANSLNVLLMTHGWQCLVCSYTVLWIMSGRKLTSFQKKNPSYATD